MILELAITVFITQLIFIGARTWNVRAVALDRLGEVLLSGAIVHLAWLVSIAIGASSTYEIINNWNWSYLPIVLCSLIGGIIGSWIGLRARRK